jgi:hypothetical protein
MHAPYNQSSSEKRESLMHVEFFHLVGGLVALFSVPFSAKSNGELQRSKNPFKVSA